MNAHPSSLSDRELLDLAAKAAGIKIPAGDHNWNLRGEAVICVDGKWGWNPLLNDGDALRLAVKLNLAIVVRPSDVRCNAWGNYNKRREFLTEGTDPYAATRRAIVRAAAALAK